MIVFVTKPFWALLMVCLVFFAYSGPAFCQGDDDAANRQISKKPTPETTSHIRQDSVLSIDEGVLSRLTEEEQNWYKRFQEGVMFFDGWAVISEEILNAIPQEQLTNKRNQTQRIGVKIGTEWCKDNNKRKIDTRMLQNWGDKIRTAIARGGEATTSVLQKIENEVDVILRNNDEVSLVAPRP